MKITREFKTGVVFITVLVLFIWGYNFLKGINFFDGPQKTYFTTYKNVQGLDLSSKVTINGLEVGKVVAITFDEKKDTKGALKVEFSVEGDFEFSKNSIAKMYSSSLLGGKSLAIVLAKDGEKAVSGDFLKGEVESDLLSSVSEKINPLQAKVENVIVGADSLMVGLNDVLNVKSRANLKSSIAHLESVIKTLKSTSIEVNNLIKANEQKLSSTLTNTEKISKGLVKITSELEKANIYKTISNFETTLKNINNVIANIESGKGSLGKLAKDEKLYNNLENASKELEELLREMKLHPKRFVHFSLFGKKDKGYKPDTKSNQEKN